MPSLPPLTPPASAAAPSSTPQQSSIPSAFMDSVTQQSILKQLQRTGWSAAQPQPDIQYVSNGIGGVSPVVKGYKMVISDPTSGATQTVSLTYDPTQAGKGSQWGLVGDVGDLPKAPTTGTPNSQAQVIGGQIWGPDPSNPNGPWISRAIDQTAQDKAKADINKSLVDAGYTQAQADALAAKTGPEIQQALAAAGASQAAQQKSLNDIAIANAKLGGEIAAQAATTEEAKARTIYTGAQTSQLQQATDIAANKAPYEIDYLKAQTAAQLASAGASQAQIQEALQKISQANAPQTVGTTLGPTSPNYVQTNPNTGQVTFTPNQNFQPKTQADIAMRVGQIQSLMQQKGAEVQAKVGTNGFSHDDALNEFNQWYDQNVAPQQQALQAAQDEAAFARAKDQAAMRTSAFTAANAAGTQMTDAFKAMVAAHPVTNPNFGAASAQLAKGQMPSNVSDLTYTAPNPMYAAALGTMNALKYIDPTAAAATGNPPPNLQSANIASMLGKPSYFAPGVPPPSGPAPAAAAPPTPAPGGPGTPNPSPGPGTPDWWNALMGRQQQSAAEQQIQARVPNPAAAAMPDWLRNGTPPPPPSQPVAPAAPNFGAISPSFSPWDQYAANYSYT